MVSVFSKACCGVRAQLAVLTARLGLELEQPRGVIKMAVVSPSAQSTSLTSPDCESPTE
jgi:hypothetical protein